MLPKKFYKMTNEEQEVYIVGKLQELYEKEKHLRKILAKVRSKHKFEVEIDRPDLLAMRED